MGRMLGAFDSDNNNDRPDLNKCPDCGCFFAQDHCPLCGKLCPEEMHAGNRKSVKPEKRKKGYSSNRVTFVEWYHSWWFIVLMMFVMPIVGIILLATSPHKTSLKIACIVVALIIAILPFAIAVLGEFFMAAFGDPPVDTSKSREEYIEACEDVDAEEFYRMADSYTGKFVSMTLKIEEKFIDGDAYDGDKYAAHYICSDIEGKELHFIIRDCIQDKNQNLIPGDIIKIYGEGAGNYSVYDEEYDLRNEPAIFVAYFEFVE
jgi:hypothetical protein